VQAVNVLLIPYYDFFLYELQRNSAVLDNFFTDEKKPIVFNNEKYLRNEILIKAVNEINKSDNNYIELQNIKKILMLKKESHKFYLKKSVNISNSYIKNLALFFADTEYSHIVMLEYIFKNTNLETSRIKKKLTDKVFI